MENPFDPRSLATLPFSPIALWQANLQMLSNLQQAWMHMFLSGKTVMDGQWTSPEPLMAAFMPFMPRIEATITPLKNEGKLAGVSDASRVTMRLTMPGLGGREQSEMLLVDAVVARAAGEGQALPLDSADLTPALEEKSGR